MWGKVSGNKLEEYGSHLHILVLNKMWVEWVSEMWDPITIYSKNEPGLLFTDGLNRKTGLLFEDGGSNNDDNNQQLNTGQLSA